MEDQMNYTFMPSLEHRALIKTTIALWNPHDIQLDDIQWEEEKWIAEDHVMGKVKELPLPESLKKKISGFIKPIGFEILKWINHYQNILSNGEIAVRDRTSLADVNKVGKSLSRLCWTPQGTVDRKKTAEELIRDENLHIAERYKLACIYCLRNDILMLWNKMPEYCRKAFYSEDNPELVRQNDLVVFWTYDIKGELTRMNDMFERNLPERCTPDKYACDCALECANKVATEHFWQNLTFEERQDYLINTAVLICDQIMGPPEDYVDVLLFLLSQMSKEQKIEVLKEHSPQFLLCLLYWPWQDFFMETANILWAFLSGDYYLLLLENILNKVQSGYKDYDYKKLFRDFWQQSPITLKEYVRDKFAHHDLFFGLVEIEDKEYLKIIYPSILDRQKLLFSDNGKHLCESFIFMNAMDLLEVYIRECMSSKDVIMKFREEFENHTRHYSSINETPAEKKDELSKFFQLLDELILEGDNKKRVAEGNTDPAAKRLCTHNK